MHMAWRLLVIDEGASRLDCARLFEGYEFDRLDWSSLTPSHLRECKADLIVTSSVLDGAALLESFRWLHTHPIATPVFSILPPHADPELLQMASATATDFAIGPARREEIHQRLARILGTPPNEVDAVGQ